MLKDVEIKLPPIDKSKSIQMDLFSNFVSNNIRSVSNTIEFWERIPKYFFSPHLVEKLRTNDGLAKRFKWKFFLDDEDYTVIFQPAIIEVGGIDKAFFPSVTEELVEEALKKILANQNQSLHDVDNIETWVKFTIGMIFRELKARGKERNKNQIKHALNVLSGTIITLVKDDNEVWKGAVLQDLVKTTRKKYEENSQLQHIARLPLFISHAINNLTTRQFNLDRLMSCHHQLSRWVYKKLIHKYTYAAFNKSHHFTYLELKNSGLLQHARESGNRRKVIEALNELVKIKVLSDYSIKEKRVGKKIQDIVYKVYSSLEFRTEQAASNKRNNDNLELSKQQAIFNLK